MCGLWLSTLKVNETVFGLRPLSVGSGFLMQAFIQEQHITTVRVAMTKIMCFSLRMGLCLPGPKEDQFQE